MMLCSQELGLKEMLRFSQENEKFVFPVHCPGHWWCVLIDRPMKLYGEFDSLCKDRRSDYVFQVLCREFKTANINISSCLSSMRCRGQENICSDKESVVSGTGLIHCPGENNSARIGEDGIKKCRTGVHLVLTKPWKRFLLVLALLYLVSMN